MESCSADCDAHGKPAGPIRDMVMLVDHGPTLVLAFPGGRGTANLVKKGREDRVRVIDAQEWRAPILAQTY